MYRSGISILDALQQREIVGNSAVAQDEAGGDADQRRPQPERGLCRTALFPPLVIRMLRMETTGAGRGADERQLLLRARCA